ncbi:MAG: thioredoxin-dependent thiol peroxidase [Alphaproteobacteria bacterium]|nr:thioredoxin-dependent thiol peroxidase [Alphaproteobacteria bacterium]
MTLAIGDVAPNFTLPTDGEKVVALSDFIGKKVIVYFYPKDATSGCTQEACSFRDYKPNFDQNNAIIIGISKDSVISHEKFKAKEELNFILASDEKGQACEQYGVWVEKSMYGRKYFGIERSTFLIDETGKIAKIWRKVSVPGHVEDVLTAAQANDRSHDDKK